MSDPLTSHGLDTDPRTTSLHDWLHEQSRQDLLRFITCGSVDDGKSTLIGRLLFYSQQIYDDQLAALTHDSRKHGTQGNQVDLALLVDGLAAEREQGITIDVAYRFFSTARRKFIAADTPGHEQYTRNMVTGASTADLAVLLIDAQLGLVTQTRRHAHLVSLMGIREVALAINKMDLVQFSPDVFHRIVEDFALSVQQLGFKGVTAIPLSALNGDNVAARSAQTPWYTGPTLLSHLESVKTNARDENARFVFPVQWVNRPNADFRGLSGTVSNGRVSVGDTVRIAASSQTAEVKRVVTFDGDLPSAAAGDAVTLVLDRDVDASRGDVLSAGDEPVETTDQFEATVVWMHHNAGHVGRNYDLKLSHQWAGAALTNIRYRVDVNTGGHEPARYLAMNEIAVCQLALSRPLAFGAYRRSPTLGRFILVDRFTRHTVAAGMISHSLRRAQNVRRQALSITREDREHLNGHRGLVVWFTGLSGSGKSTVANALEKALHAEGKRTYVLDGDNVRHGLNRDLGFTDSDRVENVRRLVEVAKLMLDAGLIVITAFISPFRAERQMARELIGEGRFVEVFVETPLSVCEQRDPKGLYKKARSGQLPNMTGINSPYEPPLRPELSLDTSTMDLDSATKKVLRSIQAQLFSH